MHCSTPSCCVSVCLYVCLSVCVWLLVPVDWLSLVLHMPFMVVYSDIRQALFYSVLLCSWIIFVGEHMTVRSRNHSLPFTSISVIFTYSDTGLLMVAVVFQSLVS